MFLETLFIIKYRMAFLLGGISEILSFKYFFYSTYYSKDNEKGFLLNSSRGTFRTSSNNKSTKGVRKSNALQGIGKGLAIFALTESTHFKIRVFNYHFFEFWNLVKFRATILDFKFLLSKKPFFWNGQNQTKIGKSNSLNQLINIFSRSGWVGDVLSFF